MKKTPFVTKQQVEEIVKQFLHHFIYMTRLASVPTRRL